MKLFYIYSLLIMTTIHDIHHELIAVVVSFLPTPKDYLNALLSASLFYKHLDAYTKEKIKEGFLVEVVEQDDSSSGNTKTSWKQFPNGRKEGDYKQENSGARIVLKDYLSVFVADTIIGSYVNNKRQGVMKGWDHGKLSFEIPFVDDEKTGIAKHYYDTGMLELKETLYKGERNGPLVGFHENGQLMTKQMFIGGKSAGSWHQYHDNGVMFEKYTPRSDNSGRMEVWDEQGYLTKRYETTNGEKHGKMEKWHPGSGKLKVKATFENGKRVSTRVIGKK
jgi:antitoxin component YwqK of YwqJK toxin-antitoxin module